MRFIRGAVRRREGVTPRTHFLPRRSIASRVTRQ